MEDLLGGLGLAAVKVGVSEAARDLFVVLVGGVTLTDEDAKTGEVMDILADRDDPITLGPEAIIIWLDDVSV